MNSAVIIDKNSLTRYNLKLCLWKLGCNVIESDNDVESVNLIITQSPKVVFLSMEYDKRRFSALVKLIKKMQSCKIVVYSDRMDKKDIVKCYRASVDDIIIDPCNENNRLQQFFKTPANNTLAKRILQPVHV